MTGAGEAWQQIQALQGELQKRFEVQHLPAPATPVHMPEGGEGGDEDEEEQRKGRRAAKWVNKRRGAAIGGFQLVLGLFDPAWFTGCEW